MHPLRKILVVEDDPEIAGVIERALANAGLALSTVPDGDRAITVARDWVPELVLLDLNIAGPDGLEVCRRLRRFSDAYVIMLSARATEADKLIGLSVGADDYMTTPFLPRELAARVQAMLRRPRGLVRPDHDDRHTGDCMAGGPAIGEDQLLVNALQVDRAAREVHVRGRLVDLTKIEFDLLATLAENVRQVCTRDRLRERVWGGSWLADEHAIDVHVSNLRRKLRAAGEPGAILTVRGVGYRINRRRNGVR